MNSPPGEMFEIAAITVAELWHGVERASSARRAERERYLRAVLDSLLIIPYTQDTAYIHARVRAELKTAGAMIGYYDLIVAATALERGSQLATFNVKHFKRIRGLDILKPG